MATAMILGLLALSVLALLAALAFLYRWIVRSRVFPQLPKLWKVDKQRFLICSGLFALFSMGFAMVGLFGVGLPQEPNPTTPPDLRPTRPSFQDKTGTKTISPNSKFNPERPEALLQQSPPPAQPNPTDVGQPPSMSGDTAQPGQIAADAAPVKPEPAPAAVSEPEPGKSIVPDLASRAETASPPAPQPQPKPEPAAPAAKAKPKPKPEPKAAAKPKAKPKPPVVANLRKKPKARPKPSKRVSAKAKAEIKAKPKPKPKPRPKPKAKAQGKELRFTVCVQSFKSKRLANKLNARLKAQGFSSRVISTQIKDMGLYHRVCVGTFTSRIKAAAQAQRIKKRGISKSPFVIGTK
jgi:hypothetical protein